MGKTALIDALLLYRLITVEFNALNSASDLISEIINKKTNKIILEIEFILKPQTEIKHSYEIICQNGEFVISKELLKKNDEVYLFIENGSILSEFDAETIKKTTNILSLSSMTSFLIKNSEKYPIDEYDIYFLPAILSLNMGILSEEKDDHTYYLINNNLKKSNRELQKFWDVIDKKS